MKDLYITDNTIDQTPLIDFRVSGKLTIEGKSFPEDPVVFYEPIIKWIKDLKETSPGSILMTVKLEYFNTSTSKLILYIFRLLESFHVEKKSDVKIIWYYYKYDEEMIESGMDYQSIVDVPFELVEYE